MTESATRILRDQLLRTHTADELSSWFDPLRISEKDGELTVVFPHALFGPWFVAKGKQSLETALQEVLGHKTVRYACASVSAPCGPITDSRVRSDENGHFFGSRFSFDTFLYNRKNAFPYQCAKDLANADEQGDHASSNPFVLWGESGTGKTHLIRAMANAMRKRGKNVFFSPGSELRIHCAQNGSSAFVRDALNAEALMVDGLDDFLTLPEIHDDVLSVMDAFTVRGKLMIFTVQRLPETEQSVSPRLFSRLEQGLAVELLKPDMDIRMQYVARRTARQSIRLNKDQMLALVHRFTEFRQIDGVLNRLESFLRRQDLLKKNAPAKIGQKDFDELLRYSAGSIRRHLTSAAVIEAAASRLSLSPADIIGDKRNQDVSKARQMAMLLCRELLHCSYPELGRIFGGKDHSTAMYSIKKAKQLLQDNKDARIAYTDILRRCKERG